VTGQHPLAHVAAVGDPDAFGQPGFQRDIDTDGGELDPFQRSSLVAHELGELRCEGGVVDMEDFRTVERIRKGFEISCLDHVDFGKFPQESFVYYIVGGVHKLGDANCHRGSTRSWYREIAYTSKIFSL
jgi:hypothetical protein